MKLFFKSLLFLIILLVMVESVTFLLLPNCNLRKYGIYNTAAYDILEEKENTVDVIALGDSLIYSSINPMQIWNDYGYTVYDCAEPAQIIADAYENLKVAIDSQHPKVVLFEANVLFRDPKKKAWYHKYIKRIQNIVPIYKYHNNWKKLFLDSDDKSWINSNKGYKYITKVEGSENYNHMKYSKTVRKIPEGNMEYFEKMLELCKENNIKFVLISTPSQVSYNYPRLSAATILAEKMGFEYLDFNLDNPLNIDWTKETKDSGGHLNYLGAQKVTSYFGEYLKNTGLLEDHRKDEKYQSWHEAYMIFQNN